MVHKNEAVWWVFEENNNNNNFVFKFPVNGKWKYSFLSVLPVTENSVMYALVTHNGLH